MGPRSTDKPRKNTLYILKTLRHLESISMQYISKSFKICINIEYLEMHSGVQEKHTI